MERDFRYLRDQHGDAGAREIFEKICTQLFQARFGSEAHNIQAHQGDDGIDILVGSFQAPIENYQCKYFIDGIGESQKSQIRSSFHHAVEAVDYTMSRWTLCVPCLLNAKEFKWWSEWRGQQQKLHNIEISLFDGGYLISELKKFDIYNQTFDNDTQLKLDEILSGIESEKSRLSEEIIVMLEDISPEDYDDTIDGQVVEILHDIFNRMAAVSDEELMGNIQDRNMVQLQADIKRAKAENSKANTEYEALKSEVIKAVQGMSKMSLDVLNELVDESRTKVIATSESLSQLLAEYDDCTSKKVLLKTELNQIRTWAEIFDTSEIDVKKMIASSIIKRVNVFDGGRLEIELNMSVQQFIDGIDSISATDNSTVETATA